MIFWNLSQRGLFGLPAVLVLLWSGCTTLPPSPCSGPRHFLSEAITEKLHPRKAVALYLHAAEESASLLTATTSSPETKAAAAMLYNKAVADCAILLQKIRFLKNPDRVFQGLGETYDLHVVDSGKAVLNPSRFDRLIDAQTIPWKQLGNHVSRSGIGGTLVGVQNNPWVEVPNRPPRGFAEPVTAVASFGKDAPSTVRQVEFSLLDPRKENFITLGKTRFPLAGDFTAPLAYFPKKDGILYGFLSMLHSDQSAKHQGIYFCEPYDPAKIPVVFVHGLASAPQAWMEFVNNLNANPKFRRRYQVCVYRYPSGAPIVVNALRLRTALAEIEARYHPRHRIILIGHSMGGILSRFQVTNSGDTFWNSLFGSKADAMRAQFSEDSILKQTLYFQANPHIERVIFIATPHRGSNLAIMPLASLPSRLIRMPTTLIRQFNSKLKAAIALINPSMTSIPTSIAGLSPKSPVLKALDKLPINVPYNSIIGNRGQDSVPLAQSSDGVVPYWSSHMEGAKSELIVPTGHDAFKSPASVAEVLRILNCDEK